MEHTNKQDVLAELCPGGSLVGWNAWTRKAGQGFIDQDSDFIPPENGGEPEEYEHFYKLSDFGVDYARPRLSQLAEIVRLAGSLDKTWAFR
ncbi:hypothetical protein JRI60_44320 [Archangium violaceum]|uniref:hypothetical protein n=1 Tax=Archangium violaceum TaxID=83451 RepID=UPI0019509B38|nr:hypothetical protein [Archangium violaceum]QRN95987.1 hypothetical protein JRI60_44320 [Archangium violaceum]